MGFQSIPIGLCRFSLSLQQVLNHVLYGSVRPSRPFRCVPVAMGLENASDVLGEHLRIDGMGWVGAEDDVSASVGARLSARN